MSHVYDRYRKDYRESFRKQVDKAVRELKERLDNTNLNEQMTKAFKAGYWGFGVYVNDFLNSKIAEEKIRPIANDLHNKGFELCISRLFGEAIVWPYFKEGNDFMAGIVNAETDGHMNFGGILHYSYEIKQRETIKHLAPICAKLETRCKELEKHVKQLEDRISELSTSL